jgi:hypothetical protein
MVYNIPKIKTFNGSNNEKLTKKLIIKEMNKIHPPHYGGPGILICDGHISESTFGDLIILDSYDKYLALKGWNLVLYPMLIIDFIVHEELHKTQNQNGMRKLFKLIETGRIKNNFTDFNKYTKSKNDRHKTICDHYYVCLYTYIWMVKHYGEKYLSIIDNIGDPYYNFNKFIRHNHIQLLKLMMKLKIAPPNVGDFV